MTYVLNKPATFTEEIRKSRFTAIAAPVTTEAAIKQFLENNSVVKATHNCWAWRIGENYRFNDDGEPGGTAGRPILQAIDTQAIDNIVVLVIRWFGGIKLGTGGLVRAYGGVANECLRLAAKSEVIPQATIKFFCPYSLIDLVQARLTTAGASVENADYGATGVVFDIQIATTAADDLCSLLINITNGSGRIL